MFKKITIFFLVLVGVIGISYLFYTKSNLLVNQPTVIKIGWPSPVTGPLASFGEPDSWIAEKITKIINQDQGGIFLTKYNKKLPIEILIRDTKSDPKFAASVTEDLILTEKVDLIVVLHTPDTTVPASLMCEKYKVPCIAFDTPVLSWLSGAPYEWSYLHFWTEPDAVEAYVGIWDLAKTSTNKKAGGLWNNDADGTTFRDVVTSIARDRGYDFVGDEGFVPYGQADYSSYIKDLKAKKVELLTTTLIPPDFAAFWKQCNDLGFHPKVATIAKSILFPSAVEELSGNSPLGLSTEIWWSKYHPGKSSFGGFTPDTLANLWEKESGRQWTQPLFYSFAAFETAIDAITRAGNLDKTQIRNAVGDTDLTTIVGQVSFKAPLSPEDQNRYQKWPKLIQYKNHYSLAPVVGGQWQKGQDWPWEIQTVFNWKYDWIPETSKMKLITK